MFSSILFPTDGSPLSTRAGEAAVALALSQNAKLTVLSVAEPYPFAPLAEAAIAEERTVYEQRSRALAQAHAEQIAAHARSAGIHCEAVVAQSYEPHGEIVKTAELRGCDLIFMASHGRKGLSRLLIGSETQKVLAHTKIPVLVYR